MPAPVTISPAQARRIAIDAQGLGRQRESDVFGVARRLGCIQIDPLNVVARTQLLVLFSRLGRSFDPAELDRELWDERRLFHYWAHAASIVLTEDFPIHQLRMRMWRGDGAWAERVHKWMKANSAFRRYVLAELKKGPRRTRDLEDRSAVPWVSEGWTHGMNISRMLEFLWAEGLVTIGGRVGSDRIWVRTDQWLPEWTPKRELTDEEAVKEAIRISLRSLGVATPKQIAQHFTRGAYPGLRERVDELVADGEVVDVKVGPRNNPWPGRWLIHVDHLPLVDASAKGWQGRTTLLSPFDNLICDRERTRRLFDFDFTIEIYVPKAKRRFGYYSLPVLDGDKLIARLDPKSDRKTGRLLVNSIHPEGGVVTNAAAARRTRRAVEDLAMWLGATAVDYPKLPDVWARVFT